MPLRHRFSLRSVCLVEHDDDVTRRGIEEEREEVRVKQVYGEHEASVLSYTVVYVEDVANSVEFYAKAFGYNVRRLDESHRWGELETGQTTIAFTTVHQHETDAVTGVVQHARSDREGEGPGGSLLRLRRRRCRFQGSGQGLLRAVENGAVPVSAPEEEKEWGQKVGYVRDIDDIVVRLGSYVSPPQHHA